jgi:hypothetical protein
MMLRRDPLEFTFKPMHGSFGSIRLSFLSVQPQRHHPSDHSPAEQRSLDSTRQIAGSPLKSLSIDEADCVVMGHLLTQRPYSGALMLIEHGHEKIGASRPTV